jgi:hypothetical protein
MKVCYPGYLCSGSFFFSLGLSPYSPSSSVCFSLSLSLYNLYLSSCLPPVFFLFRFVLSRVCLLPPVHSLLVAEDCEDDGQCRFSSLCFHPLVFFSGFTSPLLLVLYFVAHVLEMKERRQWWCRLSMVFGSRSFFFCRDEDNGRADPRLCVRCKFSNILVDSIYINFLLLHIIGC